MSPSHPLQFIPMPNVIPDHYQTEFSKNFDHGIQQRMQRLAGSVLTDTITGKEKRYNRLEKSEWRPVTTRKGTTTPQVEETALRWCRLSAFDNVHWKDEFDDTLLGDIILPNSEFLQNHVMGWNRLADYTILRAANGTAYTGTTGVTGVTLPSGSKVAVDFVESGSAANSGLTVAKLRQARYLLAENLDDEDENTGIRLSVRAKQIQDLLKFTEVTSADYNTVKALAAGTLDSYMGFKFTITKQTELNTGTDIAKCIAYVPKAIRFVKGLTKSKIAILDSQNEATQIRSACLLGAVRYWEEGVVEISCDQSP